MAATAVYAYLTEDGQPSKGKVTKAYRDAYYPNCFLLLDTAELVELPTLQQLMMLGTDDDDLPEDDDAEERLDLTTAELSLEVNSRAAGYWADRAIGRARASAFQHAA